MAQPGCESASNGPCGLAFLLDGTIPLVVDQLSPSHPFFQRNRTFTRMGEKHFHRRCIGGIVGRGHVRWGVSTQEAGARTE